MEEPNLTAEWILQHMNRKPIPSDKFESKVVEAFLKSEQGQHAKSEQIVLRLLREAPSPMDRYLRYGEILIKMGRLEDARNILIQSARIALNRKNDLWLALSHEKLGDLSAAEEDWFGALHQYRYALRKAAPLLDPTRVEKLEAKANGARSTLQSIVLSQDTNIISLSKEYLSGNLAISFIHRDIFLKKYFARCLQCNFCHDWCCSFGADIDVQNVERIRQQKEEILPFVRPPEAEWFDSEYSYYQEYAGNQYTRINTQGPRCVFISKDQRGCGLHRYAISKRMDYHEIKPLVCILFPLSFSEGILYLAAEMDDKSLVCAGPGYSAYQAMKSELEYYFGRELVEELDGIEKGVFQEYRLT
jgi:Fe-S-cluster containining protein